MRGADFRLPEKLRFAVGKQAGSTTPDIASGLRAYVSGIRGGALRSRIGGLEGIFRAPGSPEQDRRALLGRWQRSSGSGSSHGGPERHSLGTSGGRGPRFDQPVGDNGYLWWYLDALSADGKIGLTLIAFVGSVFSPTYAAARRRRSDVNPLDHCAMNAVLYNARHGRWALTEYGRSKVLRSPEALQVGTSRLAWDGDDLVVTVDERSPLRKHRLRGTVRLSADGYNARSFALDGERAQHRWHPIAPVANVVAKFDEPNLSFSGSGYLDSNFGSEPLEKGFRRWDWCRSQDGEGAMISYDVDFPDGRERRLALAADRQGGLCELAPMPRNEFGAGRWGVERRVAAEVGSGRIVEVYEDTPFYSREQICHRGWGRELRGVRETVDLERFDSRWVQALLPFRISTRGRR